MASPMTLTLTLAVLIVTQGVTAKRGCSAFGHSCFGGHGKRSDSSVIDIPAENDVMSRRQGQFGEEETPPHPGYPRSGLGPLLPSGDNIIPVRDGGVYDHEDAARDAMKYRLRNIVKHWMDSYRRSQQNNDDGFYMENM